MKCKKFKSQSLNVSWEKGVGEKCRKWVEKKLENIGGMGVPTTKALIINVEKSGFILRTQDRPQAYIEE